MSQQLVSASNDGIWFSSLSYQLPNIQDTIMMVFHTQVANALYPDNEFNLFETAALTKHISTADLPAQDSATSGSLS